MSNSEASGGLAKADAFIRRMSTNVALICGVALIMLALMICVDVFLRAAFNAPLPASVEASVLLLPWIVFPAFAFALIVGAHVRVTLITNLFPPRVQSATLIFSTAVGLLLFGGVTYFGWLHFWDSFVVREVMLAAIPLPWWAGKMAFPIGMFFIALMFLIMLLQLLAHPSNKKKEEKE